MSSFIRPRSRSVELRIKHKLLKRPFYATFDTEDDAKQKRGGPVC